MVRFFSIRVSRRAVVDIRSAEEIGKEYREKLVNIYSEERNSTSKCEEAKRLTFTASKLGDKD